MLALPLLRREAANVAKYGEMLQIGTSAFNPRQSLQTFLINLMLLLSVGLFSRGEWGPALIVLSVYVVILVVDIPMVLCTTTMSSDLSSQRSNCHQAIT